MDIDEVLLSALEFILPLVVDHFGKKVPQIAGGEKDQEEITEVTAADLLISPQGLRMSL